MKKKYFFLPCIAIFSFAEAQNLVTDGQVVWPNSNWLDPTPTHTVEAPSSSTTYERDYLTTSCDKNYVMEVHDKSEPQQTITGLGNSVGYTLFFRAAYPSDCSPAPAGTHTLTAQFSDATGVLNFTVSIPTTQGALTEITTTFTNDASASHTLKFLDAGSTNTCGILVDDVMIYPTSPSVSPGGIGTANLTTWFNFRDYTNYADQADFQSWTSRGSVPVTVDGCKGMLPVYSNGVTTVADNIIANFNPFIKYSDAANDILESQTTKNLMDITAGGAGGTVMIVHTGVGGTGLGARTIFGCETPTGEYIMHKKADFSFNTGAGSASATYTTSSRVNLMGFSGKTTSMSQYDQNGAEVSTSTSNYSCKTVSVGARKNTVGRLEFYSGNICEILTFNTVLTAVEMQRVRSYLAAKYGVTLSDNTLTGTDERDYLASDGATIFWNYSDNSAFHRNVTVIGRDDNTGLDQRKSRSTDADPTGTSGATSNSILTIDHGGAFTSDKSFFGAGHSGETLNVDHNITDIPAGIQSRMSRIWKYQKTGAGVAASVTVSFDMTGFTPLTGSDLRLLVSTTTSFASASIIAGSFAGNTFTASLPTTGGEFFTLGSVNVTSSPLPIELMSFTGVKDGNKIRLDWKTASETNNDYFTVEKSMDGQNFEGLFIVDSKAPNGNSVAPLSYTEYDGTPSEGVSYYRLKQVDNGGVGAPFEYSDIIAVEYDKAHNVTFVLYPNPTHGEFTVDFTGLENHNQVTVSVVDMQGKLIYTHSYSVDADSGKRVLIHPDVDVPAGMYFCTLDIDGIKYTAKVQVH